MVCFLSVGTDCPVRMLSTAAVIEGTPRERPEEFWSFVLVNIVIVVAVVVVVVLVVVVDPVVVLYGLVLVVDLLKDPLKQVLSDYKCHYP